MPAPESTRSKDLVNEMEILKQNQEMMAQSLQDLNEQQAKSMEEMRRMFMSLAADKGLNETPNTGGTGSTSNPPAASPPPAPNVGGPWSTSTPPAASFPSAQMPTRFSHLEFPRFFGEDVTDWVYKCEQFFDIDGTMEDMKVKVASVHMEGKAMYWHQAYMKARVTRQWPSWEEYCRALASRFGSLLFDDPMGDLKNLRQKGSVQAYLDEFDILRHRVHCLPGKPLLGLGYYQTARTPGPSRWVPGSAVPSSKRARPGGLVSFPDRPQREKIVKS